jgi:hypothetical protein
MSSGESSSYRSFRGRRWVGGKAGRAAPPQLRVAGGVGGRWRREEGGAE